MTTTTTRPEPISQHASADEVAAWLDQVEDWVCDLARRHGWLVEVHYSGRSGSRYVELTREVGEEDNETLTVRISDHAPGMCGQQADEAITAGSRYLAMMIDDVEAAISD